MAVCAVEQQQCWSIVVNPSLHGASWTPTADAAQRSGERCNGETTPRTRLSWQYMGIAVLEILLAGFSVSCEVNDDVK
jgi:hypothetical protein